MRIALIGSNGMLARKVRELAPPGYTVHGFDLPEFDLTDRDQVLATMERLQPAVIVNCAAFTNVDACETEEALATRVNGSGPGYLAEAALTTGAVLAHISTDYVYSGSQQTPYREDDPTGPISAYGRSKLAGEVAIRASGLERYFIIRTSWLYGPGGKNFVETMLRLAAEREELRVVADQVGTPTYTGDLARAIYRLMAVANHPGGFGTYNFSDLGQCSWHGFAAKIISLAKGMGTPLSAERVLPIQTSDYPLPAVRPAFSVFSKEKYLAVAGAAIPQWEESLAFYLHERLRI